MPHCWKSQITYSFTVHLPSAPTFVSARPLFNGFMVTWSAPEENADLVTGYNIMYKKKSEDIFITVSVTLWYTVKPV